MDFQIIMNLFTTILELRVTISVRSSSWLIYDYLRKVPINVFGGQRYVHFRCIFPSCIYSLWTLFSLSYFHPYWMLMFLKLDL